MTKVMMSKRLIVLILGDVFVFVFVMKEKKLKVTESLVAYLEVALAVACFAIVGIPQPSAAPPPILLLLTNCSVPYC